MYGIIIKVCKKPMTPSPSLSIHEATSFQENSRERSRKMKSIQKIYSQTKIISDLFWPRHGKQKLDISKGKKSKSLRRKNK